MFYDILFVIYEYTFSRKKKRFSFGLFFDNCVNIFETFGRKSFRRHNNDNSVYVDVYVYVYGMQTVNG